jgi:hypothetical protein
MKHLFWLLAFSLIPSTCCAMDNDTSSGSSLEIDDANSSVSQNSAQQFTQHFATIDSIEEDKKDAQQIIAKGIEKRLKNMDTLIIQNHVMESLPKLKGEYDALIYISITKGPLKDPKAIYQLLEACPYLTKLDLSHNQLPSLDITNHHSLKEFSCAYNPITSINFRRVKFLLSGLETFDASGCDKLTNFTVHPYHGSLCSPLTTITLHNTGLSDDTKKEIMKNSKVVAYSCSSGRLSFLGILGGGLCSAILGCSTAVGFGLLGFPVNVFISTLITSFVVPPFIVGPAIAYSASIGSTPREKRETTRYIVDFGPDFKPSVEEITTWYQRSVMSCPEFSCARKKGTPALEEVVVQKD